MGGMVTTLVKSPSSQLFVVGIVFFDIFKLFRVFHNASMKLINVYIMYLSYPRDQIISASVQYLFLYFLWPCMFEGRYQSPSRCGRCDHWTIERKGKDSSCAIGRGRTIGAGRSIYSPLLKYSCTAGRCSPPEMLGWNWITTEIGSAQLPFHFITGLRDSI